MNSCGASLRLAAGVALIAALPLVGPPAAHAAGEGGLPGPGAAAEEHLRRWKTTQGVVAQEATTDHLFRAAQDLLAEAYVVREELGVLDIPREGEPEEDRAPVHLYAKTLELGAAIRSVQGRLGMPGAAVGRMPATKVEVDDVLDSVSHLLVEMHRIKAHLQIDREIAPAPAVAEKTPAMTHKILADASFLLDGLPGGSMTASDVYRNAAVVLADVELIGQFMGVAVVSEPAAGDLALDAPETITEVARQALAATAKAIDLQARLGMSASRQPGGRLVRATPSEAYGVTNALLAELARVKFHLGIDDVPDEAPEPTDKGLTDLLALISVIDANLERLTGGVTLEVFVRIVESQEALDGVAASQPAEPGLSPCPILSAPNVSDVIPSYPRRGRIDYGSAVITVRFVVDDAGDTVNEEVAVVPEQSSADQPSHFDRFAQAAIKQVQGWSVELPNRDEQSCSMAQAATITVRFDY